MHINQSSNRGFSTVFFLMALLLISSIHSQLGQIILHSSRIIHSKKKLMIDRRNDEKEILRILNSTSETTSSRIISERYAKMTSYVLETSNRRNIPIHIHGNSMHTPLVWRKFLSTGETLEVCNETSNAYCTINTLSLSDINKLSQGKLIIKDTLLVQFTNSTVALGVSGKLDIKNLVFKRRDEKIEQRRELLLLAASESIRIQHIDSELTYLDIVFYTAQGKVILESIPPHNTCLSKNPNLPGIFIFAQQILIDGKEMHTSNYACIPLMAKDWFPGKKMLGFSRIEP
jgi:hypothetical protein